MDFDLSTEQQLLKDSVEKFIADEYEFSKRRDLAMSEQGFSREHWQMFADLGWLGVAIPEAFGGLGGDAVDVMVLMEAFGKGLVVEPFLTTAILGAGLVREAGTVAHKQAVLPAVARGQCLLAFAFAEARSRSELNTVSLRATREGEGWVLRGAKNAVLHGPSADFYIVTARTAGAERDANGISLFLVPRDSSGLERLDARAFDAMPLSELNFNSVTLGAEALMGEVDGASPVIEQIVDEAIAALCAQAVGAMEAVHSATNEFLKTRKQFGQPIGQFQVLQHRMVDMYIALEESRSLTFLATLTLGAGAAQRRRAVACAKSEIGEAGKFIGGQAVQLHGGMGMTDELNISHYYKHLMMSDILFGNSAHHLNAFAKLTQS